jgi:5-methylthioribose kinase
MPEMLAKHKIAQFLRSRNLSTAEDAHWTIRRLTGGVSGVLFSAYDGANSFVVKQSLGALAVDEPWLAPRDRILTEARVLDIIAGVVPDHCPTILDIDDHSLTITLEHAPVGWSDLKTELLGGHIDLSLTRRLGSTLGAIHVATIGNDWSLPPDDGASGFVSLRIDPFHKEVAKRHPDIASTVLRVAERTMATRTCLVHGDFSPKNILVGPHRFGNRSFWIIDGEVGHRGDPTFDVAFYLAHLMLKRIGMVAMGVELCAAAAAFMAGYVAVAPPPVTEILAQQLGCLVMSRVSGRSPVNYLSPDQLTTAISAGKELILNPHRFDAMNPLIHMPATWEKK